MSNEDSRTKLLEASKLFAAGSYQQCEEILNKIPGGTEDPKVAHNIALCQYLSKGGNSNEVLATLGQGSADLKFLDEATPCFDYEGQEVALVNQAAICLHNGEASKALTILQALARTGDNFKPVVKARIAVLLHCTANAAGKSQQGTSQAVKQLISGAEAELKADKSLMMMTQLALGDASNLEAWYNSMSGKTPTDRCVLHNNLGVKTAERGKTHLACLHFSLALKNLSEVPEKDRDIFLLESILFNQGLMSLSHGGASTARDEVVNPTAVLDSFLVCQRTMEGSARLWWHIAQVCAWWLREELSTSTLEAYRKKQVELHEAIRSSGAVPSHATLLAIPTQVDVSGSNLVGKDNAALSKWSENGLLAVKNAIWLLQGNASSSTGLLQQVWVLGAFFESTRRNHAVALRYANDVISHYQKQRKQHLDNTHPQYRIDNNVMISALGYAVESLCFVNRPAAAVKLLQSINLGDLLTNSESQAPFQCPGANKSQVDALFINLCVVHIANGSYKQAQAISTAVLAKCTSANNAQQVQGGSKNQSNIAKAGVILQAVLELAQGNRDKAVDLVAKNSVQPPFFK